MLYLMSAPPAYRALQAEIDEGIKAGNISDPVTNAEANEMPYLQVSIPSHTHPPPIPLSPPKSRTCSRIEYKH